MRKTLPTRRWLAVLLTLTLCLTLMPAALADDPPADVKIKDISISLSNNSLSLEENGTETLIATVLPVWDDGNKYDIPDTFQPDVTWKSDKESVATVSDDGVVTAVSSTGSPANITATATYTLPDGSTASATASCEVKVLSPTPPTPTLTVDKITVSFTEVSLTVGETKTLTPTVTAHMSDNTTQNVTSGYTLSATSDGIVSVSGSSVKGLAVGSTTRTFTIKYQGETTTADCTFQVTAAPITAVTISTPSESRITMDVGSGGRTVSASTTPIGGTIKWESSDPDVAYVDEARKQIIAVAPGQAVIRATCGDVQSTREITVTVNGFKLKEGPFTVTEGGIISWEDIFEPYGSAGIGDLSFKSGNPAIASYVQNKGIQGNRAGISTFNATYKGKIYEFTVTVTLDEAYTIDLTGNGPYYVGRNLKFSDILSKFKTPSGTLSRIMGLRVSSTSAGTLFYNYQSDDIPNLGVGSSAYYRNPTSGQRGIGDVTFVPKSGYSGEVNIFYTAVSDGGQNYACKIVLNVESGGGNGSDSTNVSLTTEYNTAVKLNGLEFDQVCRQLTGANLDYVIFSLPPVSQGTLYTNYSSTGNYGSQVSSGARYSKNALDDVWFVPAPGFPTGSSPATVTIYYTGHSRRASNNSYKGQLTITVNPENNTAIGGLAYDVSVGGVAYLDDEDFNRYCRDDLMDTRQTLSFIRFDSLPSAGEGVLYYDYRSSTNTGSRAAVGTSYYYGTRAPRIDRLVFVPAADFVGTIKLPFTGQTVDGTRFSGNVEINVRGGAGTGDIYYSCAPGRSVSFRISDFTSLSRDLTGNTLNYIQFKSLPNSADGSLYHNSTRISATGTRYYNSGGASRISNLSFRAGSSFSGTVDIPFTGTDSRGNTFDAVITIGAGGSGSTGGNIRYTANAKSAAVFERDDFDSLSWDETREYINTVRFKIPSSSEGTLYRGYRSGSNMGTKITTDNYSVSASALDQVAFVPAGGYTGTVYLEFTATALNNGGTFDGTVEIEVGRAPADVTVSYSTRNTNPVTFYGGDFGRSGSTLSSIRFTALPSSNEGYLYYQYTSPTRYGRLASTGTSYRLSGGDLISELTFVPRAGYTGTVSIPYTGTNSNNSTFEGEVLVTVSPSYSSAYFSDMSGYSESQRAAVDFLYERGITHGLTATQYGPEASIRRGDFALMLYQAFELSPAGSAGAFTDVPGSAYYAQAVNALYARGIVSGVGGGIYAPDSTLTRQDAICMVQRAMRNMGWSAGDGYESALYGYSDGGSVSAYARGAMAFAVRQGYLPTYGGYLNPTQALTRVDMAEILHRVLTY